MALRNKAACQIRFLMKATVFVIALAAAPHIADAQPAQPQQPRMYVALGVGPGVLTSTATERFSNAVALSATVGSRLSHCMHLVVGGDAMLMARSSDAKHSLSVMGVVIGLGWTVMPTLQVRAMAGIAIEETRLYGSVLDPDADHDAGIVAGAAAAWLPLRGRDYAAGFEVGDQLILNNGELRQSIGVTLLVQLSMPFPRGRTMPPPVVASVRSGSR